MVGSRQLRELHERLYEANERRIREMVSTPRRFTRQDLDRYEADLAASIGSVLSIEGNADVEQALFTQISTSLKSFSANLAKLEKALKAASSLHGDVKAQAEAYRDLVFKTMGELRKDADILETLIDEEYWPMPTYSKLLFNL